MSTENLNIQDVLVQQLRTVDNNGDMSIAFPHQTFVYRYPVPDGWIVATMTGCMGSPAIAQSFVYDPGRDWNPSTIQPLGRRSEPGTQS
jgi:hypothetical protein